MSGPLVSITVRGAFQLSVARSTASRRDGVFMRLQPASGTPAGWHRAVEAILKGPWPNVSVSTVGSRTIWDEPGELGLCFQDAGEAISTPDGDAIVLASRVAQTLLHLPKAHAWGPMGSPLQRRRQK